MARRIVKKILLEDISTDTIKHYKRVWEEVPDEPAPKEVAPKKAAAKKAAPKKAAPKKAAAKDE